MNQLNIARHKTAMRRYALSRPLALAMSHGLISSSTSVFDFGCGHGADVKLLRKAGITAAGWDPHFSPDAPILSADCVNLGYVLNVIEDQSERMLTLRKAFKLARNLLIVAVRVDQSLNDAAEFSDGVLTKVGSFQKLYTQEEFRVYLQTKLGCKPHMASLGIAYIFRNEHAESEYLANLLLYRPKSLSDSLISEFSKDRIAQRYIAIFKSLGRAPVPSEFKSFTKLIERFGSPQRIERIASGLLDTDAITAAREKRRGDILTYLAMMRLQGLNPPPIRTLSEEVQADVKMSFSSYKTAIQAAESFLFQLGKPELIKQSCRETTIGKRLPDDLYVHKTAESQLPALLNLLIFAARQVIGEVEYDLVKISLDGRKVSFLRYRDFENSAHPELLYSLRVHLPKSTYSIRDYSTSLNPPILHRKETFLDPLYPRYGEYAALTEAEDKLELLSRPEIGTRNGWHALLNVHNLRITDHSIVPITVSPKDQSAL
jgi:DNA phosphorothioation-associated putative methyltransferase